MKKKENNYAFIDSNNLYLGVSKDIVKNGEKIYCGWKLDYKKFRVYLRDKYKIERAYIFIGYNHFNTALYQKLQEDGYICIFKPILELGDGRVKGNVDSELVLHSMIHYKNYDKAVIVSGDGDFFCLVEYLRDQGKLSRVLVPNQKSYSSLLERLSAPERNILSFVNQLKEKLEYKKLSKNEKSSRRDQPLREL